MKSDQANTINVIQACAYTAAAEMAHKLPSNLLAALMAANNRVLKAAIIEHGGQLRISPESVYEMLQDAAHVVAISEKDGSFTLSLAAKERADEPNSDVLPL